MGRHSRRHINTTYAHFPANIQHPLFNIQSTTASHTTYPPPTLPPLQVTLPKIGSMFFLLLIYMFISSVAGMQLLGQVLPHEERARFDGFAISMLTIFQFLTGENWNEAMYAGIYYSGSFMICIYFIIVIVIGLFIVLNLFLAILLSDFDAVRLIKFT